MNLERLFRQIVLNLAAKDPGGLRRALSLAEVRDGVVPYRANRRALGIETSEDYELALLRLYAGKPAWPVPPLPRPGRSSPGNSVVLIPIWPSSSSMRRPRSGSIPQQWRGSWIRSRT